MSQNNLIMMLVWCIFGFFYILITKFDSGEQKFYENRHFKKLHNTIIYLIIGGPIIIINCFLFDYSILYFKKLNNYIVEKTK